MQNWKPSAFDLNAFITKCLKPAGKTENKLKLLTRIVLQGLPKKASQDFRKKRIQDCAGFLFIFKARLKAYSELCKGKMFLQPTTVKNHENITNIPLFP